jgi:lysophospholipid acyltransferase (LPLAT)-like uncharacterized protein
MMTWKKRRRHFIRKVRNLLVRVLGPPLVRWWMKSLRVRWLGEDIRRERRLPATPAGIYVFWHQRMLALAGLLAGSRLKVLVSQHGDGQMIASVVSGLGMQAIRGSSTRGGTKALLEILREKELQGALAITPDGPRGPKYVFREGAVYLASRTGLPIHLVTVSFQRYVSLPTWDGFIIPWPFSRTIVRLAETIHLPPDLGREELELHRKRIEGRLVEVTESTDREFRDLYGKAKDFRSLEAARPGTDR